MGKVVLLGLVLLWVGPPCRGGLGAAWCLAAAPVPLGTRDLLPGNLAAASRADSDGLIASPEPDWPQWRGPRRDGVSEEKGLLPAWPEKGPTLLWKIDHLGHGWSSPIIVGDQLFITGDVGDDLVIYAFDMEGKRGQSPFPGTAQRVLRTNGDCPLFRGKPRWQTKNGEAWTGSYPGARACGVYSEDKLYHISAHGRVVCLAVATGKELWSCDLQQRFGASLPTWAFSECLLVDGPRLIVTPGGGKALMAALDKRDGRTVWTTEPLPGDRATYSAPLLFRHGGQRMVANCSSAHGFGVDADTGKLLWTVPLRNTYGVNVTMPVYGNGSVFFVTSYSGGACYRVPLDGSGLSAEKVWDTGLDCCTGAVVLVDDVLLGSGYQKQRGWLSIDWKSGQVRYEFKGLPACSAMYADGRLYCLAENGEAALLKPASDRFEVKGRFRLVPEKTHDAWSYPVVLHGRLYLRYHDTLWCYDVRGRH